MKYLLDVNAVVALLFAVHPHHARARAWILSLKRDDVLLLTPWVEMAFLRVGLQTRLLPDLAIGRQLLAGFPTGSAGLERLSDDSPADDLPAWVTGAKQIGDGHLLALAQRHSARLATFDSDIPGAFALP